MNGPRAVELLLVEDNPEDLELALRALRKVDLATSIHVARDGAEALEYIFCEGPYAARRIADTPKLILLDLKLPKINGLEVLKRIKGHPHTKAIPVVVLTSSKVPCDVEASYALGTNSYVVKPMNSEQYTRSVRELGLFWLRLNQPPKGADH